MMEWLTLYLVLGLIFHAVGEAEQSNLDGPHFGVAETFLAVLGWPLVIVLVIWEATRRD